MKPIRIQRKRPSSATMMIRWGGFLTNWIVRPLLQPYIDQDKAIIAQAKLDKIRTDTELAEARKQNQMNSVVISDLKIEKEKIQLELLEYKARMLGLRSNAGDWTCSHCGTENTGMVKVCTACNAPKP